MKERNRPKEGAPGALPENLMEAARIVAGVFARKKGLDFVPGSRLYPRGRETQTP